MFVWLRNKIRNRQRAIFRFWDGRYERGIDPISTHLAIIAHPTYNSETDPYLADLDTPEGHEAHAKMVRACQDVFGIPVFAEVNGKTVGLTNYECINLMVDFNQYLIALKKNINGQQIGPDVTKSAPSESPTKPPADSGSTSTGSIYGSHQQS